MNELKAIDERSYEYSREHQMPREEYLTRLYQIQDEAIKNVEAIKIIFHNQPNPAAHDIQIVLDMAKRERDRRTQPENKQYDPKFCTGCRSVDNDADDYPCNECRRAYTDKFEPEQEEK